MKYAIIFFLFACFGIMSFGQAVYYTGADYAQTANENYSGVTSGAVMLWGIQVTDNNTATPWWAFYDANNADKTRCTFEPRLLSDVWGNDCLECLCRDDNAWKWRIKGPDNWMDSRIGKPMTMAVTHNGFRPYLYGDGDAQSITWKQDVDRTVWLHNLTVGSYPADVERWNEGMSAMIYHQILILDYYLSATAIKNLHLRGDVGGFGAENGCKNYIKGFQDYQPGDVPASTPEGVPNRGSQGIMNAVNKPPIRESFIPVRRLKMF